MGASLHRLPPLTIHFSVGGVAGLKNSGPPSCFPIPLSNALSLESELVNLLLRTLLIPP